MSDPMRWDWADAIVGAVLGVLSGVVSLVGWFASKIAGVHRRINTLEGERVNRQDVRLATLEAHHQATLHRLGRIEDSVVAINEKQDRQMEILAEIRQR